MPDQLPRPFLKWAGGKTRLLGELMSRLPPAFRGYHEPSVGSGALFFGLYRRGMIRCATLSDLNEELIGTYIAVRDHVGQVVQELSQFPYNPEFYYALRSRDPAQLDLPLRAARMIYLNKTGYNGLYRVNRQGKFNVPFGRYKSPTYCDEENLHAVSRALQDTELVCAPFDRVLRTAEAGDLVYFDPPYAPLSRTANFTSYHARGFSAEDQQRLRDICVELAKQGVQVMVSNSDSELIRRLYTSEYFTISEVQANRAINCVAEKRGKITELIVTSYAVEKG